MIMFIRNSLKKLLSIFPRYTLHFVDKQTNEADRNDKYHILAIGENTPITLSAREILNDKNIKEQLEPDELMRFYFQYFQNHEKDNTYFLKELGHDGKIILKNKHQELMRTCEEFCNEPSLMERTFSLDVYRIVSQTYFKYGRNFEKELSSNKLEEGVILKLIKHHNE